MLQYIILGLFILSLGICLIGNISILYALIFGMFLFIFYSYKSGFSKREIVNMLMEGVLKIKNILIIFGLIGILTAVWRMSGTIPFILYYSVDLIKPEIFVLSTFLLCCTMSFLIGTSMGTAGTMGVICMMISNTIGINPLITGGAIISGIYFGDRCSPMSSSAQLVAALTDTEIYENIKNMIYTSIVPFVISCIFYYFVSRNTIEAAVNTQYVKVLEDYFNLNIVVIIPALIILTFALLKINVKTSMAVSILSSLVIAIFVQKVQVTELLSCMINGYRSSSNNEEIGALLNGGGLLSMVKVACIVLISSTYSGILSKTDILKSIKKKMVFFSERITPFGISMFTSILAVCVSCNQALSVMLVDEMCNDLYEDKYEVACALENTAIVISALIPWSIAVAVPLQTIGASSGSILYAVYLFLLPLWNFIISLKERIKRVDSISA